MGVADSDSAAASPATAIANPVVAAVMAFLVPGLGHVYLKRAMRGLLFFALVLVTLIVGWQLQGNLPRAMQGQPLSYLATAGAMGMGLPYYLLRYGMHYEGNLVAPGFEYGSAFILTAGLMNLLLVLDAWDIASGKKE
jgi:hypothetical protein